MTKILKILAWSAITVTGLSALCLAGLFVYVAKPHIKRHEWPASARPTTIQVMYVAMACGEHSPRLYEVVAQNDNSQSWSRSPTILALPKGMPSPEDTEFAVGGNVFVLTGFRYRGKERNVLTGETRITERRALMSWLGRSARHTTYGLRRANGTCGTSPIAWLRPRTVPCDLQCGTTKCAECLANNFAE